MWKFLFNKVIKMREKVAIDLGDNDPEKPFLEHLEDLRTMLIRMALVIAVSSLVTFTYCNWFMGLILRPLNFVKLADGTVLAQHVQIVGIKPHSMFFTALNVSMAAGIVISFPLLFYFLLQFILPGMRSKEKKFIFPAMAVGAGLFITGVLFAYFVVTPKTLLFFYEFGKKMIDEVLVKGPNEDKYIWNIEEYTKFVCQFCLLFGACFELPVVVMALVKFGILSYRIMKATRSWALIVIVIIAAIMTPTQDAVTMCLLAAPMYGLYEICIYLAWRMEKKDRELHPEYYKGLDEDLKALEAKDDWDNETYNPWHGDKEEEESASAPATPVSPGAAPSGTVPHHPETPPTGGSEGGDEHRPESRRHD